VIALLVYGLAVGLLIVVGARAAESLARSAGLPVRWIWFGAMIATLILSLTASLRGARTARLPIYATAHVKTIAPLATPAPPTLLARVGTVFGDAQQPLNDALARTTRAASTVVSARVLRGAIAAWALMGLALLGIFFVVQRRMRRARRAWPLTDVAGARVRLSPTVGPLVAGVIRPEIVVPRWVLERRANEQQMVVAHEAEHVRAHDPALLGVACIALAAMPWNPALWYMFSRLRLAVELDCDARVLRAGSAPGSYGALLIDVAERASLIRLSALALADDTSHLYQRILAMKPERARFGMARGGVAASLALVALLAACAAELPTAAQVDQMDASTAAASAKRLARAAGADTAIAYYVDGLRVTESEAKAIDHNQIAQVEISKSASGAAQVQLKRIRPGAAADSEFVVNAHAGPVTLRNRVALRTDGTPGDTVQGTAMLYLRKTPLMGVGTKPVLFIDGVKVKESAFEKLDPKSIASIDVIKGPAAAATYGADAEHGAIIVHTKNAANKH
jgi:TonB-dependent SusC/RagA subfamily outer membrane receptor